MKKLFILSMITFLSIMAFACSDKDEPESEKTDEITRVKDGNGKVFVENGVLVNANIDYTAAELNKALTEYEWILDYAFYYDNSHVSSRISDLTKICPTNIHVDGTMEYSNYPLQEAKIRDISVKGKELTATCQRLPVHSSTYIPSITYIIVALNLNSEGESMMIMDQKIMKAPLEGYDDNSSWIRMVWKSTPK